MILHTALEALGGEDATFAPQTPLPSMHEARPRDATHIKVRQPRVREIHTPPPGRLIRNPSAVTHGLSGAADRPSGSGFITRVATPPVGS